MLALVSGLRFAGPTLSIQIIDLYWQKKKKKQTTTTKTHITASIYVNNETAEDPWFRPANTPVTKEATLFRILASSVANKNHNLNGSSHP